MGPDPDNATVTATSTATSPSPSPSSSPSPSTSPSTATATTTATPAATSIATSSAPPKVKQRTSSNTHHLVSNLNPASNRKGRYADTAMTTMHADRPSISMPPPPSIPRSRTSSSYSIKSSATDTSRQIPILENSARRASQADIAVEDFDPPRLSPGIMTDDPSKFSPLPDAALRSKPSVPDIETKRMSVSSMYSLSSARAGGAPSSTASANGSEGGYNTRATSGTLSPNKPMGGAETSTSAISVTTSSSGPFSNNGSANGPSLTPRETPAHASDMAKRNAAQRGEGAPRSTVPTRSRSRAKRRFSGSTGASSHSPSSDRGDRMYYSKKEEDTKPSLYGVIGVCALDVKARSKPSRNILNRLLANREFEVKVFGDKVILDEDIENWPLCDYLISFYSDGFPLDKAIAYVKTRKPFCVNDVPMQKILWDRRICLMILDKINVPTPKRVEVNRDGGPSLLTPELANVLRETTGVVLIGPDDGTGGQAPMPRQVELVEDGDVLSVDGVYLRKPFIEKPISGEDHNLIVYYPKSQGGGARKLFRKIGNKSSEKVEGMNTPRAILEPSSSYLYEKFMHVDNSEDVKAYTVGPTFCHAETRKSPVVDGLVRRNTHGKEIRYITSLSKEEAAMASRIAVSFGQRVCGFDLLRAEGKSFVIDVNGWSFVKDNDEYYEQCSRILREMFLKERNRRNGHAEDPSSSTSHPSPSDGTISPLSRRDTFKENHRSALQTILSKSPSMSKLHVGHHKKALGHSSPGASSVPTPRTSPPSGADKGSSMPSVPATPMLPPPAVSAPSTTLPSARSSVVASTVAQESISEPNLMDPPAPKHTWKLKGMVSVIRHADRTPKQKYKFTFHTKPFVGLLKGHQEEVLLTGAAALDSVIVAVDLARKEGIEDQQKLRNLRNVLAKKGGWAGTKVQIKPMFRKRLPEEILSTISGLDSSGTGSTKDRVKELAEDFPEGESTNSRDVKRPPTRSDSLSGITLSRITAAENSLVLDKLQLIVKWGGEPTHSARYQSQELGENMRNDLMLMNREVLDEVHVFSSSERRVTTSAQIWASAFTNQPHLPSDFITIRKDLLDDSNAAKDEMDKVKKKLKTLLRQGIEAPPQFAWPTNMPEPSIVQAYVVQLMKFHRRVMRHNYGKLYGGASTSLSAIANPGDKNPSKTDKGQASGPTTSAMAQATATTGIQSRWCCGEDADLFKERWEKLFTEFCDGDKVDPSKISELYDTMKFDALHNRQFLEWVFTPGKSILDEEEEALAAESKGRERGPPRDVGPDDATVDQSQTTPLEKTDTNKSVRHRIFRRRESMMKDSKAVEEQTEQYFKLFTGSGQTKAKTDARLEKLRELYKLAKVLFDFICPQEYGITDHEKLEIGLLTSLPLLKEIVQDLEEMQASDDAKSFIYFTKESHIYTLLNCILEGGVETKIKRSAIPELDYLSQICFELYESENKTPPDAPPGDVAKYAYSIRISISPGAHTFDPLDVQLDSKHCISCAQRRSLTAHGDWKKVIETLRAKFHQVKLPKSFLAVNLSESHTFHKKEELEDKGDPEQKDLSHPLSPGPSSSPTIGIGAAESLPPSSVPSSLDPHPNV
ncbi:histidine phosphatase superfamily-domain-containing protein [Amylocarpus encephaloides]|uniref:Inositol hexakisphosphate and diphosphoinositol-pentakisphosphate kinase n=1 Tax=Amylocarpus encephaloides TaxID=45428 RepID=A0A9P7Y9C4_9HELO|nr:histidine phosphatase superfamily-domain-containing protein [Amylocarpus encephaloides]